MGCGRGAEGRLVEVLQRQHLVDQLAGRGGGGLLRAGAAAGRLRGVGVLGRGRGVVGRGLGRRLTGALAGRRAPLPALPPGAHGGHQVVGLVLGGARAQEGVPGETAGEGLLVLAQPPRLVVEGLDRTVLHVVVPGGATLATARVEGDQHRPGTVRLGAGRVPGDTLGRHTSALQPLADPPVEGVRAVGPALRPDVGGLGQPDDVLALGQHRPLEAVDAGQVPPGRRGDLLGRLTGADHRLDLARRGRRLRPVGPGRCTAGAQGGAETVVDRYRIPRPRLVLEDQAAVVVQLGELQLLHGPPLCHLRGLRPHRHAAQRPQQRRLG